ncbi:MAG: histidinol-phosphate transaminase [Candidatus Caldarchaeum sp.]|nr:histidinol-phosphate transaminase [Candidatus Caldarchaeum sp.]
MMLSMVSLRSGLDGFIPYSWEISSREIAERYGLRVEDVVRMDLNTSPYVPKKWLNILAKKLPNISVNLYPDTSYLSFRQAVSEYTGRDVDEILVGNGGDECLMIAAQAFLEKGRKAVISHPTYSYFRVCSEIMGAQVEKVPRKPDYGDDVEAIIQAADKATGLIFLCSPNNPTGNLLKTEDIKKIVENVECPVVVDEAYHEYSGQTCANLVSSYPNLIVVRTLSKAFSLAGARVGYSLAAEETITTLNKVRPPNSLSVISLELAQTALKNAKQVRKWAAQVVSERKRLAKKLSKFNNIEVVESQANFLLIKLHDRQAEEVHQKLMSYGIVVRDISAVIPNALRITVATPRQNNRLIRVLTKIFERG